MVYFKLDIYFAGFVGGNNQNYFVQKDFDPKFLKFAQIISKFSQFSKIF